MEIRQIILTYHAPAFQGHWTSLEPTRISRPPRTSFQWSMVTMGPPISYHFEIKGLQNFPTSRTFNAPAEGVPLGILQRRSVMLTRTGHTRTRTKPTRTRTRTMT